MKYEQKVQIEMSEYICLVKRIDGVVAQKTLEQELIRCADCKWNKSSGDWIDCPMSGMHGRKASDNYCSLAERREE